MMCQMVSGPPDGYAKGVADNHPRRAEEGVSGHIGRHGKGRPDRLFPGAELTPLRWPALTPWSGKADFGSRPVVCFSVRRRNGGIASAVSVNLGVAGVRLRLLHAALLRSATMGRIGRPPVGRAAERGSPGCRPGVPTSVVSISNRLRSLVSVPSSLVAGLPAERPACFASLLTRHGRSRFRPGRLQPRQLDALLGQQLA